MKRAMMSLAIVSALAFAGCSRDGPPGADGGTANAPGVPSTNPAGQAPGAPGQPGAQPGPTQPGAPPGTQAGVAPPEIREVFDRASNGRMLSFTATYRFTRGLGDAEEVTTWRLAQQPPKFRFERTSGRDRELWVSDGKTIHACDSVAGRRNCNEFPASDQESLFGPSHPDSFIEQLRSLTTMMGRGIEPERTSRTIRGRRMDCARFVGTGSGVRDRFLCLTEEGVVGYATHAETTITLMRLRSGAPRASEFAAPS